jgi:hypothetical protein
VKKASQEDDAGRIKAIIAENGRQWTTRRELLRKLSRRWSEVQPTINDLEASGEIERATIKGERGPASEKYRLALQR